MNFICLLPMKICLINNKHQNQISNDLNELADRLLDDWATFVWIGRWLLLSGFSTRRFIQGKLSSVSSSFLHYPLLNVAEKAWNDIPPARYENTDGDSSRQAVYARQQESILSSIIIIIAGNISSWIIEFECVGAVSKLVANMWE